MAIRSHELAMHVPKQVILSQAGTMMHVAKLRVIQNVNDDL